MKARIEKLEKDVEELKQMINGMGRNRKYQSYFAWLEKMFKKKKRWKYDKLREKAEAEGLSWQMICKAKADCGWIGLVKKGQRIFYWVDERGEK